MRPRHFDLEVDHHGHRCHAGAMGGVLKQYAMLQCRLGLRDPTLDGAIESAARVAKDVMSWQGLSNEHRGTLHVHVVHLVEPLRGGLLPLVAPRSVTCHEMDAAT